MNAFLDAWAKGLLGAMPPERDWGIKPMTMNIATGDYVLVEGGRSKQQMWLEVIGGGVALEGKLHSRPIPEGLSHGETVLFFVNDIKRHVPAAQVPHLLTQDFFRLPPEQDEQFDRAWFEMADAENPLRPEDEITFTDDRGATVSLTVQGMVEAVTRSIKANQVAAEKLRQLAGLDPRVVAMVITKLDEAELWLGRVFDNR